MIVQVSEKHAVGEYGESISDKEIKEETIAKCSDTHWWKYIVIGGYNLYDICYIDTTENMFYPQSPYSSYKTFKKNTVITFTQDKLS